MTDLCFICEKLLSEGESVIVVRGLKTLKSASIDRNDGHIDFLNTLTSVNVHVSCRKMYINKNYIAASKRRLEEGESSTSTSAPHKKRNEVFDFKKLCLFCGQTADVAAESRKKRKYQRKISNVSTLEFKDKVIKRAEERKDSLGELVKDRVLYEYDLIAAEAKYHAICYTNFLNRAPSAENKSRENDQVTEAMKEIFSYMESHEDSQFKLRELKDVLTQYVPDDKTIIARLQQKYLTDIVITRKLGSFTVISFRDKHSNILSKTWHANRKTTPEEERLRIVEAAASIVKEDIRASVVKTKSYLPPSKMLDDINQEIPKTLFHFLHEIILKNRKGKMDHLKTKCTAISHAIMAEEEEDED